MRTFGASSGSDNTGPSRRADYRAGMLSARFPSALSGGSGIALPAPGLRALPSFPSPSFPARECLLYIPSELPVDRPVPFLVMLHGAGGDPEPMVTLVQPQADKHGVVVLAPPSVGRSWDMILDRDYGPDVQALDLWLDHVLHHLHVPVDPQQAAIGGFSDGASYALSLGLINGDVWSHVLAFSPGFMRVTREGGPPTVRVFISHGKADNVLPIHRCSRQLVPKVQRAGYPLDYAEFEGAHTVPEPILDRAFEWLIRKEEGMAGEVGSVDQER